MSLTKARHRMIQTPVVNADDFIPAGTDTSTTDCTSYIQSAVDAGSTVLFSNKTYKIAGTVEIPSNTHLQGSFVTEFLGIMTAEGSGGYPNQMFRNSDLVSGNENIQFSKIKFNFAKGSYNYDTGSSLTSINSLYFQLVENLRFEDCEFFDFVTNFNNTLTGRDLLKFGILASSSHANPADEHWEVLLPLTQQLFASPHPPLSAMLSPQES